MSMDAQFIDDWLREKDAMTFCEAAQAWLADAAQRKKRSLKDDTERLAWVCQWFDPDIKSITGQSLMELRDLRTKKPGNRGMPLKRSTINRYMLAVSGVLHFSWRMGWIPNVPPISLYKENNEGRGWLTTEQAKRLIEELPLRLACMVQYSLATGVRQKNCTGLEWSHINWKTNRVRVPSLQFKQGVVFSYPINDDAIAAIDRANKTSEQHKRFVFQYQGERINNPNTVTFRNACVRAGLTPGNVHGLEEGQRFRWHDLRHTWATWHVMSGTPVHILKELGGWKSTAIVERYYHLAETFTSQYAGNVSMDKLEGNIYL